jgi:hypothetical protein
MFAGKVENKKAKKDVKVFKLVIDSFLVQMFWPFLRFTCHRKGKLRNSI